MRRVIEVGCAVLTSECVLKTSGRVDRFAGRLDSEMVVEYEETVAEVCIPPGTNPVIAQGRSLPDR